MSDPSGALTAPRSSEPIPEIADLLLHFPDLISPSYWLMWVIKQVSGVNPLEWATEHFSGDWEKMSEAADALRKLADFHDRYAGEIEDAARTVGAGWDGKAAGAADDYLASVSQAVESQARVLRSAAGEVDQVAFGMSSLQTALVSVIGVLLDWALVAAASAAAAAASSWTIVGGILGGASTAFAISQATRAWLKAIQIHGAAVTAVDALVGVMAGYLGAIEDFSAVPLPAGSVGPTKAT